jgi:hypothetical protein
MAINDENAAPISANVMVSSPVAPLKLNLQACNLPMTSERSPLFEKKLVNSLESEEVVASEKENFAVFVDAAEKPQASLEEYKKFIDATTEIQSPASPADEIECSNEMPDVAQHSVEWQDRVTGAMMGYAACDEVDGEDDMNSKDSSEDSQPSNFTDSETCYEDYADEPQSLQVSVEWKEECSGIMMGYMMCDENNKDLQAMQQIFGEGCNASMAPQAFVEWENSETGTLLGYAVCADGIDNEAILSQMDDSYSENNEDLEATQQVFREGDGACVAQTGLAEWEDSETGTVLGYAVCDDGSEDDSMQSQMDNSCVEDIPTGNCFAEWEDPKTGAVMGYECDEDSDIGDDFEWEDPNTGVKMNYAYDEEDVFADETESYRTWDARKEKKTCKPGSEQNKKALTVASRLHRMRLVKCLQKRRCRRGN